MKLLRGRQHSARSERVALGAARHYAAAERAARGGLRGGGASARVLGDRFVANAASAIRGLAGPDVVPSWRANTPAAAPRLPSTLREGAAAVYLPACVNRIFGHPRGEPKHPSLPEALVAISKRAGLPLWIPHDVAGHCCGTPWSSKGFERGHAHMTDRTAEALHRWSGGRLPIVLDATSCTYGLRGNAPAAGVQILDSVEWIHDHLLERLELPCKLGTVAVHPTCSGNHLGLGGKLEAIAAQIAEDVFIPAGSGCCGMAGDRGWLHPELPASALRDVAHELEGRSPDACISSNRTCEAALQEVTGQPYRSVVLLLEELTRGAPRERSCRRKVAL
jgi:D-lactate dehydrogenase